MASHPSGRNMTVGSPAGHILAVSLPLLAGSFLQQFYNLVDSWVVGNFVSDAALAAVGMGFPVMTLFQALFIGLSTGGTVIIAQYYGAGKVEQVKTAVDTIYTGFVRSVVPVTIIALLLLKPMLHLLRVDESAFHEAWVYLAVVMTGLVGTIGYNFNAGILNGLGNSRTTLRFLVVAAVMNIVLDLVFVLVFRWGVFGVAFATVLAQTFSWLYGVWYINRHYPEIAIHPFSGHLDHELLRKIVEIGLPAGLQMSLVSIAVLAMTSKINSFGTETYGAGFNVGNKLDSVAFLPVQSLCSAATAFVGQNMGAGKDDRAVRGTWVTVGIGAVWTAICSLVLLRWGHVFAAFFTPEQAVVDATTLYLDCVMPPYILFTTFYIINAALRGAGDSVFPMVNTIASMLVVRVPVTYLLANLFGPEYMYWSYAVGWVVGCAFSLWYYCSGRWKKKGSLAK